AYGYTQEFMAAPASEDEPALWARLASAAAKAASSDAAVVLVADEDRPARIVAVAGPLADRLGELTTTDVRSVEALSRTGGVQRIVTGSSGIVDELASPIGARYAAVVTFPIENGRRAFLIHLSRHASLFGADDSSLLAALGRVVGLLVERRAVLAEQESLALRLTTTV